MTRRGRVVLRPARSRRCRRHRRRPGRPGGRVEGPGRARGRRAVVDGGVPLEGLAGAEVTQGWSCSFRTPCPLSVPICGEVAAPIWAARRTSRSSGLGPGSDTVDVERGGGPMPLAPLRRRVQLARSAHLSAGTRHPCRAADGRAVDAAADRVADSGAGALVEAPAGDEPGATRDSEVARRDLGRRSRPRSRCAPRRGRRRSARPGRRSSSWRCQAPACWMLVDSGVKSPTASVRSRTPSR